MPPAVIRHPVNCSPLDTPRYTPANVAGITWFGEVASHLELLEFHKLLILTKMLKYSQLSVSVIGLTSTSLNLQSNERQCAENWQAYLIYSKTVIKFVKFTSMKHELFHFQVIWSMNSWHLNSELPSQTLKGCWSSSIYWKCLFIKIFQFNFKDFSF